MNFEQVRLPAADPETVTAWYGRLFDVDAETLDANTTQLQLGETTLQFEAATETPPAHLAVRLLADADRAVDWLTDRATILPVEGESSRWFEFLDATAIYIDDPEANVVEALCYTGDPRPKNEIAVDGVTEVGLPAHETFTLVEWLEETVGLSSWGTPSENFAWVGDRHARFVVVSAGQEWYPTDRNADLTPVSVTVVDESAQPGRHSHPTLPYEIRVTHDR